MNSLYLFPKIFSLFSKGTKKYSTLTRSARTIKDALFASLPVSRSFLNRTIRALFNGNESVRENVQSFSQKRARIDTDLLIHLKSKAEEDRREFFSSRKTMILLVSTTFFIEREINERLSFKKTPRSSQKNT